MPNLESDVGLFLNWQGLLMVLRYRAIPPGQQVKACQKDILQIPYKMRIVAGNRRTALVGQLKDRSHSATSQETPESLQAGTRVFLPLLVPQPLIWKDIQLLNMEGPFVIMVRSY